MSETGEQQGHQMPQPGAEHQLLKPFEGTFAAEVKIWMGPGDPVVTTGTMVNSFQLGGLYLHQNYVGDTSESPFPSFLGQGYWGYNTTTKEYEGFWIDNASTTMQLEYGVVDADGRVWEMCSEFIVPGSDQSMKKRTVITLIDNDHHSMASLMEFPGQPEFKNMEITYQRKA